MGQCPGRIRENWVLLGELRAPPLPRNTFGLFGLEPNAIAPGDVPGNIALTLLQGQSLIVGILLPSAATMLVIPWRHLVCSIVLLVFLLVAVVDRSPERNSFVFNLLHKQSNAIKTGLNG